jgi:hypothetical protein
MNNEMNKEQQELLDDAYNDYCSSFSDSIIEPNTKELFIEKCKHNVEYSIRWGLKIEERELSLEERYGLSRVNGISPKYSFEIEDGKPTPNKMSESEWYDNHNIPTKLITITYNDKRIESYEGNINKE